MSDCRHVALFTEATYVGGGERFLAEVVGGVLADGVAVDLFCRPDCPWNDIFGKLPEYADGQLRRINFGREKKISGSTVDASTVKK
jgi:hypothetical protein